MGVKKQLFRTKFSPGKISKASNEKRFLHVAGENAHEGILFFRVAHEAFEDERFQSGRDARIVFARHYIGSLASLTVLDELYGLGYRRTELDDAKFEAVTLEQVKVQSDLPKRLPRDRGGLGIFSKVDSSYGLGSGHNHRLPSAASATTSSKV